MKSNNNRKVSCHLHYGAVAFLLPRLVLLWRKHTNTEDIPSRSFIDSFLVLAGYMLSQNEDVIQWVRNFEDYTVPAFNDETDRVRAQLFMECAKLTASSEGNKASILSKILNFLDGEGIRLSRRMGKALLDCLHTDPEFTELVIPRMHDYIRSNIEETRLPLRIFYLSLSHLSADDYTMMAAHFERSLKQKKKLQLQLQPSEQILQARSVDKKGIKKKIRSNDFEIRQLEKMLKLSLAARNYMRGSEKRIHKTNTHLLQIFLEDIDGIERSKSMHHLIAEFKDEDELLEQMGFYSGHTIDGTACSQFSNKSFALLPKTNSEGIFIRHCNDEWKADDSRVPIPMPGDILGIKYVTAELVPD